MVKNILLSILFAVTLPSALFAQGVAFDRMTPPLPTEGERKAADIASWFTVGAAIAIDAHETIGKCMNQDDCYRAITMSAIRNGVTFGAVYGLKKLIGRERPCHALYSFTGATEADVCGADDPFASFPSGHTAFAFSAIGNTKLQFSIPLAIGTGGLRVAAGKHWLTDTLAGAGIGLLTSRIR